MRSSLRVGTRELKLHLGRYLSRVRRGDRIVVTARREPIAEIRPIGDPRDPRAVKLASLAAAGDLTLPTRAALVRLAPVNPSSGSASAAVSADRDDRG